MRSILKFLTAWYGYASGPLRRSDPLLMGAAFAYNALFAFVPLSLAFVSVLTMFDSTSTAIDDLSQWIDSTLPADLATLLNQVLMESVEAVGSNRLIIVVVTTLIALWSGSRAVYAVQKALRLMDPAEDDGAVGYVRMRGTAILVTLGAGIAVIAGYVLLLVGAATVGRFNIGLGEPSQLLPRGVVVAISAAWLFALVYVVYRWGAPKPVVRPIITAGFVTAVIFVGTWAAANVLPSNVAASVAVFGAIGIMLLWLYGIGIVVVGGPIVVSSFSEVIETKAQR